MFYSNNFYPSILKKFLSLHTSVLNALELSKDLISRQFKYQNFNSLASQTFLSIQHLRVPYFYLLDAGDILDQF